MERISSGRLRNGKGVVGVVALVFGGEVFRRGGFRLCCLVDATEEVFTRRWIREIRRLVDEDVLADAIFLGEGFICCWILELRRTVDT